MSALTLFPKDTWTVAEGRTEEGLFVVRYRDELVERGDRQRLPHLVRVNWTYEGDQTNGLPTNDEMGQMEQFENTVCFASERDGWGILVAAVTQNFCKEWRFYTDDRSRFQSGFNDALDALDLLPIELSAREDPHWDALYELHEGSE